MIEYEKVKTYYEGERIKTATCDTCGADIFDKKFYRVEMSFVEVEANKNDTKRYINRVYDYHPMSFHICQTCAIPIKNLNGKFKEYMDEAEEYCND